MRLLLVILGVFLASFQAAHAQSRVALVIGNGDYQHATSLPNPTNDAREIAKKFQSLGFNVVEGYNLTHAETRSTLREFARVANEADLAVFFYAGHGIAVQGENYLVPVDASLDDPIDWEFQVFPIEEVLHRLRHAKGANIVLLDACRDNPLAEVLAASMGTSTRSLGARGLSLIDADAEGAGMAIAFATSPGEVAEDGQDGHSPFTLALLKHIGSANTDFVEVMSRVTGEVYASTDKRQRPWLNTSLTGPVIFNPVKQAQPEQVPVSLGDAGTAEPQTSGGASGSGTVEMQKYLFDVARESKDPADYQNYLDLYPDGLFAGAARNALARLSEDQGSAIENAQVANATPAAAPVERPEEVFTRTLSSPLSLIATPYVQSQPGSQATEDALLLSKEQRLEIQGRLNASGNDVGAADGSFGRRTRQGISAWQGQNSLIPTGYLNALQLQMLTANTDMAYRTWLSTQQTASRAPVRQPSSVARQSQSTSQTQTAEPSSGSSGGSIAESLLKGLAEGIGEGIGKAIFD